MSADSGVITFKLMGVAAAEAAPAIAGAAAAQVFGIPLLIYLAATFFSLLGIVTRHLFDIGEKMKTGENVKPDFKAFALDLGTAPMLGIGLYIVCVKLGIEGIFAAGFIMFFSFLGPAWLRALGQAILSGIAEVVVKKIGGAKP